MATNKNAIKRKKNKKKKPKYKWSNIREFKFIKPIKWLPGFRSGKHWKRITALMYLSITPFSLILKFGDDMPYFGVFVWIMLLSVPFMICSFASYVKTKDRFYATEALIAAAVFAVDNIVLVQTLNSLIEKM